jgi:hypothetical protein
VYEKTALVVQGKNIYCCIALHVKALVLKRQGDTFVCCPAFILGEVKKSGEFVIQVD